MNLAQSYAQVILDAQAKPNAKAFGDSLVAYMKSKGHTALIPQVLRMIERAPKKDSAIVIVKNDSDAKKYKKDIEASLSALGVTGAHQTVEDPRVVGGYSVRAKGKMIDKSFRTALVSLYHASVK